MVQNTKQNSFLQELKVVFYIFAVFVLIEAINLVTGRVLNQFSITPREISSLPYVLSAPFLHASVQHFLSNIFTLCIFSFLVLQYGKYKFLYVHLFLIIGTGILVWLFGRKAYHLGASGIIYGQFGFLLLAGFVSKRLSLAFISIGVGFVYGAMIWGVLPSQPYVSWESHLFGFCCGLVVAYFLKNKA